MDMTTDAALIQRCVSSNDTTTCIDGCQWRHGKNNSTDTEPETVPMFSTDFCHPVTVTGNTTESEWNVCFNQATPSDCTMEPGCNWSTGKELIPDHPFCAPADLTDDLTTIKGCIGVQMDYDCVAPCQWR
jgi:hypothetical protein